jgi:hypothetical protein
MHNFLPTLYMDMNDINNFEERTKSVVEITSKQDKEK